MATDYSKCIPTKPWVKVLKPNKKCYYHPNKKPTHSYRFGALWVIQPKDASKPIFIAGEMGRLSKTNQSPIDVVLHANKWKTKASQHDYKLCIVLTDETGIGERGTYELTKLFLRKYKDNNKYLIGIFALNMYLIIRENKNATTENRQAHYYIFLYPKNQLKPNGTIAEIDTTNYQTAMKDINYGLVSDVGL